MRIFILVALCFIFACKSQKDGFPSEDCQSYNDKYVEYASKREVDSALFYIDKSIKCNKNDDFYKFEKVKLLVSADEYEKAYDYLDALLSKREPTFKMYKGVLGLKLQKREASNFLQEAYNEFKNLEKYNGKKDHNIAFYKSGLDYYFEGRKYAKKAVLEYKQLFEKSSYSLETLEVAEKLIETNGKEQVLYEMFNIN